MIIFLKIIELSNLKFGTKIAFYFRLKMNACRNTFKQEVRIEEITKKKLESSIVKKIEGGI